jgi:sialate O-acetylesterase
MNIKHYIAVFLLCVCVSLSYVTQAEVRLPRLIRDSMILQRDTKINVWGWANVGEKVKITFNNKRYSATTSNNGKWLIQLAGMKAGGPYTMSIDAANHIILKDILVGDVWLCSGQSNMQHYMALHRERYADDIAQANNPNIRQFLIPTVTDLQSLHDDLPIGSWKSANAEDVLQFSAVAYFFAQKLYEKYHVPIGLINASVGGTPAEAWISEAGFNEFPAITNTIQKNKDTAYINSTNRAAWLSNANRPKQQDKGLDAPVKWFDTSYIAKGWRSINIPGYWEDQGIKDLDGIVWYKKEINIPASMIGVPAKIAMGRIVDADFVYVNGKLVGNTSYQYPQRRYAIPGDLLKAGKNIITVRVINNGGKGGFVPGKPYYLAVGKDTMDLKSDWQYKVGDAFVPYKSTANAISLQDQPTALYNGMLAPVTNYNLKGFLWYQGETNTWRASEYAGILRALINDWRNQWKQENLPFVYVQLPNFMDAQYLPSESQWALLREAQLKTLTVPNTAMAVAIDLGEWNDIHPDNKKDVGVRLALATQKVAYDDNDVVYSGPLFQSSRVDGNKITITFTNVGSGLVTNDGEAPYYFAIAGADKKFVWAKGRIQGEKVIVWNENISQPVYVRYAWADNPEGANLYNKEGLPASPFRTDAPIP